MVGNKLTLIKSRFPKDEKSHYDIAYEMAERIEALIYEYDKKIPLALAIGVIEIVKIEIIEQA